ncbi:putative sperm associated antigen 17 [Operophtera brumata]|uniref:Putative sperm associated antigen 17 n=1 Tax=Operophtera brumata TaxID=104452 RepID=A0A0L7KVU6_OPEBR|nr:putative sperm associated antigen 17 [Operophtera brumata]
MGPEKKGKEVFDENYWRTSIEQAALDEDNWKVKVIIIEAAGSDQDRMYLNKFELFAAEEKRFVIKNICKTETIFMINQLGGEKKVKDDNLRVFEEGQAYLKVKKDIPPDIQALIIKHLILKMKVEYLFIKRQRLEVKQGMKNESLTMIDRTEVRSTVSVKPPPPPPEPPKAKGKKEEPDPASLLPEPAEGKKYNTLLRVRGEEWRDKVYVDDFPTDGPNLYVAVTGFVEPLLCGCLIKIGIPLTAIVQVRIDPGVTKIPSQHLHYLDNMDILNIPEDVGDERHSSYYNQQIEDLPLECVTVYSVLDGILRTVCRSKKLDERSSTTSLSTGATLNQPQKSFDDKEKTEKAENLVKEVFSALCQTDVSKKAYCLTYGEEYEAHKDPTVVSYGDFAKYNTFHLGNINLDNIVGSSLHCMPINKLWQQQRRPQGELEAKINFHVNVLMSCFEREDIETAELSRLIHILSCRKLFNNRSSFKKRRLQSSTISEFKKIYLKRSVLAQPLSRCPLLRTSSSTSPYFLSTAKCENISDSSLDEDPETRRINFLFDCPDISELVSAAEIAIEKPINHLIDDFEYFEDFSGISSYQIMLEAFNKFNCVDYKYCEVTDCFVLMFFNSHDKDGIAREEWRCHLSTPLCLQDFFDFVLEEHYDWIKNEETIYDETIVLKTQSLFQDLIDPFAIKLCVENSEVDLELLMEGSLKYQVLAEMEDVSPEELFTTVESSKKKIVSSISTVDSKSSKKNKSATTSTPKKVKHSFTANGLDSTKTVSQEILDTCESFRISSKDEIIINIKKQTYKEPVAVMPDPSIEKTKPKESPTEKLSTSIPHIFETKLFYSFSVTWPNGLITESVHENNSPVISHIKQFNIFPVLNFDEEMRCISLNGEVVVFKINGDVEVLKPDGTIIKITKYEKRIFVPEVQEDIASEISSDKTKKSKGKEKPKESSNKTSKNTLIEQIPEEKEPEYEFIIKQFEIIESSGLRQQWINDNSIDIEKLLIRTATDYCLGEVFSRRIDGTNILLNKDGVLVVTFPNKTRIITQYIIEDDEIYPEWTEIEKEYFDILGVTDTIKSTGSTSPKSSDDLYSASLGSSSSENTYIEERENEKERTDGYVSVQVMFTIEHTNFTTVTINKANENISVESPSGSIVVVDTKNNYDITLDSLTKAQFNGETLHITYEACSECQSFTNCDIKVKADEMSSVTKVQQHLMTMKDSFCKRINVNEEGSITVTDELCSESSLQVTEERANPEKYIEVADDKPTDGKSENSVSHGKCREIYLSKTVRFFVFRRDLSCSELVHRSLLEQYKMDCCWQPWCSINQYDTFGDHRSLMSILMPVHLTATEDLKKDSGKGFYQWMRPYKRFESKPSKPDNVLPPRLPRAFILSNESLQHIPIVDRRSEDEIRIDDASQALAHRIYKDLKVRTADDVRSRAEANITTKVGQEPEELSVLGEMDEEDIDEVKTLEEERASLMNNAAGEAVTKAERRKMKCVCADEAPSTPGGTQPYM